MKLAVALLATLAILAGLAVMQRDRLRGFWHGAALRIQTLRDGLEVQRDVMITMPDGVRLASDIYLPRGAAKGVAALLIRLPYGKNGFEGALWWVRTFAAEGYGVVVQDLRGRYGSGGVFAPYAHGAEDGAATLDWIAAQPWSNGKVATAGCSALGEVQLIQAKTRNPHLSALIAEGAGGAIGDGGASRGYFGIYEGGIPNLAAAYGWFSAAGGKTADRMQPASIDPAQVIGALPSGTLVSRHREDPTDYEDFMARFEDPAYWRALGYLAADDQFAAPALHVNSWHDIALRGTFEAAALMRRNAVTEAARAHQHVLIGPGLHCNFAAPFLAGKVGDLAVRKGADLDYTALYRGWLDHWLRDGPMPDLAQYTYYMTGANRWQRSATWPPPDAEAQAWYLGGDGTLSRSRPAEGSATYRHNPADPVPSIGGPICCTGGLALRAGPLDQRPNDGRADLLAFRSPVLKAPLAIAGDIRAEIAFSSDAPDTDLVAILTDIAPDGAMVTIQQGALRLRYRKGFDAPAPLIAGETVSATVQFPPIAHEVARGHRIGLHLSSASFPRLERNLNGPGPNQLDTVPRVATNTVHFGAGRSVLVLPVQPENRAD